MYIPNTYVPKGMQAMYGEPFSAFGRGNKKKWDGESKQGSLGPESKIILQRGTRFRDTKGEKRIESTLTWKLSNRGRNRE